jgi:hypothetical protein
MRQRQDSFVRAESGDLLVSDAESLHVIGQNFAGDREGNFLEIRVSNEIGVIGPELVDSLGE